MKKCASVYIKKQDNFIPKHQSSSLSLEQTASFLSSKKYSRKYESLEALQSLQKQNNKQGRVKKKKHKSKKRRYILKKNLNKQVQDLTHVLAGLSVAAPQEPTRTLTSEEQEFWQDALSVLTMTPAAQSPLP